MKYSRRIFSCSVTMKHELFLVYASKLTSLQVFYVFLYSTYMFYSNKLTSLILTRSWSSSFQFHSISAVGSDLWLSESNVVVLLPHSGTPLGTPQGTPVGTPRGSRDAGGGDSSDTLSETDSQKSLRMRRKLPSIPAHQEAVSLPSSKKR